MACNFDTDLSIMNWDFEIIFKNAENYEKHWDSPTQNVFENARLSYYTRPFGRKARAVLSSPQDNYCHFCTATKCRVNDSSHATSKTVGSTLPRTLE